MTFFTFKSLNGSTVISKIKKGKKVSAECIMKSCPFLFLDLLPKRKERNHPQTEVYPSFVLELIKQKNERQSLCGGRWYP